MKTLSIAVRRTHLYLTLLCLPWFMMYGITAIAFSHANWFAPDDLYNLSSSNWSVKETWPCVIPVPAEGEVPREVGSELLELAGLPVNAFSVGRWGSQEIVVYILDVWQIRRLVYDLNRQELKLYQHPPDARILLAGLHARAGYRHDSLANDIWGFMVDLVSIGILVWIATGLYMWWQQRRMRKIGLVALLLGLASFLTFMFTL